MKFPPIPFFYILLQLLTVQAYPPCEFSHLPASIRRVSSNPSTPLRIRFILSSPPSVCQLKVKIPTNTVVTFNLTSTSGVDSRVDRDLAQAGDKLTHDIFVINNRKTLMVVNASEEFGSRFGRYKLNEREVYGVPYAESIYRPVEGGRCSSEGGGGFEMMGRLRTTANFRRCLSYNQEKGKNEEDYLICARCKNTPSLNDDNTVISFDMENLTELEYRITCRIETEDDGVNYSLRFIQMCSN